MWSPSVPTVDVDPTLRNDLLTGTGTDIRFLNPAAGAVGQNLNVVLKETLSISTFGAVGDYNGITGTDNYPMIQAAIDRLFLLGGGLLHIPKGFYRISHPLNLAGTAASTGRFGNCPIVFQGEGMGNAFDTGSWLTYGGSWIIGQTAGPNPEDGWIMDCTGLQYFRCSDMAFRGTGANASTKGILCARSTGVQFSHDQRFDRCTIWVDSSPAITSVGSIGLANNGAETFEFEQGWIIADTPVTITFNNPQDLNLKSPYVTIGGPTSSTMMNFRNTTFQALTGYATRIQGGSNISFDTCIWTAEAGNTTNKAIQFVAGQTGTAHCQDIRITGQIENFPGAFRFDDAQTWNIDANIMMPSPTSEYVSTGGVEMNNCRFNIHHTFGSVPQAMFNCGSASKMNGGEINVYAGGSVTSNANLLTYGTTIRGHNKDLTGALGLAAGSTYLASGIGGVTIAPAAKLAIVPNGANNAISGVSPDVASTYKTPDGRIQCAGNIIPNGATVIAAGVAAGTLDLAHRPDREVDGIVYISGVIGYMRILANGQIYFGIAVNPGDVANINGFSFQQINAV